jgi:pullulanase-type alpha-1,6-glucosidase
MSNRRLITNSLQILVFLAYLVSPIGSQVAQAEGFPSEIMVGLPGTHQDELGCSGEWQPDCDKTLLAYDAEDDVYQATFLIEPDNDDDQKGPRYKVALNGSWAENYGRNATKDGPDIPLVVPEAMEVKFYYDHKTHWITDNFNTPILVATGDFQAQLGCAINDDAGCLRSWLQDPDGDGNYSFITDLLSAGTYSISIVQNEDPNDVVVESQTFTVESDGDEIYFGFSSSNNSLTVSSGGAPVGSLSSRKAIWVSLDTIIWEVSASPRYSYSLVYSNAGDLQLGENGIEGGTEIPLTYRTARLSDELRAAYPYLSTLPSFQLDSPDPELLKSILKGQVAVQARDTDGNVIDATGVQIPGVLDALYDYNGPLGVSFDGDIPTLRVWAPSAVAVNVKVYETEVGDEAETVPMVWDSASGVWSVVGQANWYGQYYLYEVEVYVPSTGRIETNLVQDPYSFSVSMNSTRSQIINLDDPELAPAGWDTLEKPALEAPEDIVVYELHVRDFSISDLSVPEELRGTYLAFTQSDSDGMQHLRSLAEAGLTHLHLLPVFDIASVNEDRSTWQTVNEADLRQLPPDSDQQKLAVSAIVGSDGFNWGYDPVLYTVPDGSFTTQPNGPTRIVEFRQMVQAVNETGLRVVMDVVYNHTNSSGQDPNSILDKIVPGYYYRLDETGQVTTSTCCQNTATEHEFMRKLMVDSVVTWAVHYKVDGFRFDLMGHHMLADMQAVRSALDELTLEEDGVDGKSIYIYGEGWDFGEVAGNARGVNASQLNISGTGIGVFNDRLRDAVRGGSPFDDPRIQGFATGLYLAANANESRSPDAQLARLLEYSDWIRIGLAGNLADYQLVPSGGELVSGASVTYNGSPAGYTADPQENIIYVSAHDNETIFDAIQVKASAGTTLGERIRMNTLALSIPMFSQGVPFFHAGDDILRSKSLDRNSYNSGDWFNRLDWTYATDNWGVGLPIEGASYDAIFQPLLADPALAPAAADIQFSRTEFTELLSIRKSSPLFRLRTAAEVSTSLTFLNTGPDQLPGLIVMRLSDVAGIDPKYSEVLVLFNANPAEAVFADSLLADQNYTLHPVQKRSIDPVVRNASYETASGSFAIPGYTTAVFVVRDSPDLVAPTVIAAGLVAVLGALALLLKNRPGRKAR